MSDQYVLQDTPIYTTTARPIPVTAPRATAPSSGGSGLATGIMVCGVFVVVAIMAAAFYSPGSMSSQEINTPEASVVSSDGTAVPTPAEATPAIEPTIDPAPAAADMPAVAPGTDSQTTAPAAADPAGADPNAADPAAATDPAAAPTTAAPANGAAAPAAPVQP